MPIGVGMSFNEDYIFVKSENKGRSWADAHLRVRHVYCVVAVVVGRHGIHIHINTHFRFRLLSSVFVDGTKEPFQFACVLQM